MTAKQCLGWLGLALVVVGCTTTPTPVPTVAATTVPTVALSSTQEPSALAVTPTPTDTPEPSATDTPTPNATATRPAPQATKVAANKYPAPVPLGPSRPTRFRDGNDIKFTYAAVGRLAANQCYLLHVEMINPNVNPGNRGDDFLDQDSCGDQSVRGKPLTFTLYRGRFQNLPNYGTIFSQALNLAPLSGDQLLQVTWYVRVVQNNGLSSDGVHYRVVPSSPPSAVLDFDFEP